MGTTIVLADPISPEDAAEIAGWGKDPAGVGFLNLVWRSKEQHVLVRAGGRPGHSRSPTGAVVAPLLTMVHTCRGLSWPSRGVKLASLPW